MFIPQIFLRFRAGIVIFVQVNRAVNFSSPPTGRDILFTDKKEKEYTITDVLDRDEAFTQIVGYSQVKWQVVG